MTEAERTGRRITIGIAWLAAAPPVLLLCGLIAAGYPVLKTTVISEGAVPVVLSWLLIQGRRWVRTLVVIAFGVNAAAAIIQLFRLEWTLTTMLLLSTDAVVHGLAAVILAASPQVRAFFAYQNRVATLDLSSTYRG